MGGMILALLLFQTPPAYFPACTQERIWEFRSESKLTPKGLDWYCDGKKWNWVDFVNSISFVTDYPSPEALIIQSPVEKSWVISDSGGAVIVQVGADGVISVHSEALLKAIAGGRVRVRP